MSQAPAILPGDRAWRARALDRELRPRWLRPVSALTAVAIHAAVALLLLAPSAAPPPSPLEAIEVTISLLGDASQDRRETPAPAADNPDPKPAEYKPQPDATPEPLPTPDPPPTPPPHEDPPPPSRAPEPADAAPAPEPTPSPSPLPTPDSPPVAALAGPPAPAPQVTAALVGTPLQPARPAAKPKPRPAPAAPGPAGPPPQSAARLGAVDGAQTASQLSRKTYGALLSAEIGRHKVYPAAARAMGATGAVIVVLSVDGTGRIVSHAITRSSGNADLDREVDVMLAGVRAPPPPGGSFHAAVTIRFDMD